MRAQHLIGVLDGKPCRILGHDNETGRYEVVVEPYTVEVFDAPSGQIVPKERHTRMYWPEDVSPVTHPATPEGLTPDEALAAGYSVYYPRNREIEPVHCYHFVLGEDGVFVTRREYENEVVVDQLT